MKVIFTTNIDKYKTVEWPVFTDHVPRKGEIIYVSESYDSYCQSERIPNRLEVCAVRYKEYQSSSYGSVSERFETVAVVELWFNEIDFKVYGSGEKLLN